MKFDLETHAELRIHAYDTGAITLAVPGGLQLALAVDPETGLCQVTESLILTGRQVITEWVPEQIAELTAAHLEEVLNLDPELVFGAEAVGKCVTVHAHVFSGRGCCFLLA